MIRKLKKILLELGTFLKHGTVLRDAEIIIKNSSISHDRVEIFGNVHIQNSSVEAGSRIYNFSTLTNSTLKGNKIGKNCTIGNSSIGAHSYIADFAMVNNLTIGKFCSVGPGFKCGLGSHPHNFISSSPFFYEELNDTGKKIYSEYEKITVGNDVWIGANVFIKDGVNVGDGAIIAAGAVVLKDVEDYAIVAGVPAKKIRYRHDPETVAALKKSAWWDNDVEWLKSNRQHFQKGISGLNDIIAITGY